MAKTIYILTEGDYQDKMVIGVFDSLLLLTIAKQSHNSKYPNLSDEVRFSAHDLNWDTTQNKELGYEDEKQLIEALERLQKENQDLKRVNHALKCQVENISQGTDEL